MSPTEQNTQTYGPLSLYIDGVFRGSASTMAVVNPATGCEIGQLPIASLSDLDSALGAAKRGFDTWRKVSPKDRADLMRNAAALLRERQDEIAYCITLENGKPFEAARAEVIRGCEFLEWDAGEAVRTYGRVIPSASGTKYTVHHQPIGPVAAFSPWNFPMSQPARKIGGALASGCSVILKAAEETPAGALHIAKAFHDVGLPPGVLNLVFGDPATISTHLIASNTIKLVAFTGSTAVGRTLTHLATEALVPVLMELGGHAPVIVCEDTNVVLAALTSASRAMRNSGQVCTSPTRFYVHSSIFDEFVTQMTNHVGKIVVGNGLDKATQMGPLANERRVLALCELVDDAVKCGATLATGGRRVEAEGYFFEPTVLVSVPDNARIMQEEPFGPVAIVNSYETLDGAIEAANSVPFGLAAYAFTNRCDYVDRLVEGVEAGNLSINTLEASLPETPFGGVKSSGFGREGGSEGLSHYMVIKNVSHSMEIL